MIVFAKFQQIINRGRVFAGFITGNLHLVVADSGSQLALRFIVVYAHVYHSLDQTTTSPATLMCCFYSCDNRIAISLFCGG